MIKGIFSSILFNLVVICGHIQGLFHGFYSWFSVFLPLCPCFAAGEGLEYSGEPLIREESVEVEPSADGRSDTAGTTVQEEEEEKEKSPSPDQQSQESEVPWLNTPLFFVQVFIVFIKAAFVSNSH